MKLKVQEAIRQAMKARDKLRLETLRGILTAIQYEEIEKKVNELSSEQCCSIFQGELKKRKESLEYAEQGKRLELVTKLKTEISIIEEFLPKQLSESELETIITELKNKNPSINMGLAMKALKDSYVGKYDAKLASDIAKRLLG